ncbi:MAG TPA: glutamate--tRNA ligase [Candidatus Marinimicrobia bacterium]|jgi:glutamyl-tRNA synthetase|nr:glutamate--tRNA ligase [Candidatus Neomarinimicrobiota bacterium]HIL86465.1 glutamate--tRNA ligase [Candidatus Neomarinimicrobiota bacterium]
MNKPIVRFAPSPTGYLHIGGARTALFNWLYAKKNGGTFLLRIEDTDLERSKAEYIDQITDALGWLGFDWDDNVVLQSKNKSRHEEVVNQMVQAGTAYRCFLSKEELDALRKESEKRKELFRVPKTYRDYSLDQQQALIDEGKAFTVRLKIPDGITEFSDLVYGTIKVDNKELDDFIIARSDGSPTYNFVVAIDDSDMNISHIIRGDDHLANTPKQILVYKALGLAIPIFAHLPMILGADKKRLSKRHAATNVQEYKEKGFTPTAIINYLSLLGWNPDSDQEIFNINELISAFNFNQVQKKPATFDEKKLLWVSGQQMARMETSAAVKEIESLDSNWGINQDNKYKNDVIALVKDRSKTLNDLIEISDVFFKETISYDQDMSQKILDDSAIQVVKDLHEALNIEDNWRKDALESIFDNLMTQHELGLGKLIKPVRFALTGLGYGPGIFDMMFLLGKDRCLNRLSEAAKL